MKKILIIDDEMAYVRLLRDNLSRNYEVISSQDGTEGFAVAKKEKPDLILLDIRMPRMDGMTLLEELRKNDYGKTAKVILLTNLEASDKIVAQVTKDLPTYYFVKSDIRLDELLDKIQDLLAEPASEQEKK